MHIAFHIGAHATDEDQLVASLLKNSETFQEHSVAAPHPNRYRKILADTSAQLQGDPAPLEAQDFILDQILGAFEPERLVLCFDNFLCGPRRVFEGGLLYPIAGEKSKALRNLFPDEEVSFFMATRNPATFVPAFLAKYPDVDRATVMAQLNLEGMIWSDVIRDIREENPDCPVTVWCNEDTPLIWPEIMHEITGIDPSVNFKGGLDIVAKIMQREGMQRLRAYMGEHNPANEEQRRKILTAFLDKYLIEDEVEEEIDLPGWTDALVESLTDAYDADMDELADIEGVTFITP